MHGSIGKGLKTDRFKAFFFISGGNQFNYNPEHDIHSNITEVRSVERRTGQHRVWLGFCIRSWTRKGNFIRNPKHFSDCAVFYNRLIVVRMVRLSKKMRLPIIVILTWDIWSIVKCFATVLDYSVDVYTRVEENCKCITKFTIKNDCLNVIICYLFEIKVKITKTITKFVWHKNQITWYFIIAITK